MSACIGFYGIYDKETILPIICYCPLVFGLLSLVISIHISFISPLPGCDRDPGDRLSSGVAPLPCLGRDKIVRDNCRVLLPLFSHILSITHFLIVMNTSNILGGSYFIAMRVILVFLGIHEITQHRILDLKSRR